MSLSPSSTHQLANTVLLIRSVIRRSAETADSLEDYVMHLEARLDSIHRVFAALICDPGKTFDLYQMIDDELEEQGAYQSGGARLLSGPKVTVAPAAAQVLGLVFQELVTNAIQHGAMGSEDGGQLHVGWAIVETEDGAQLQLEWTERGEVKPPRRQGFGTTVLEGVLPYQLDGRATRRFDRNGLRITLAIPVTSLAATSGEALDLP